MSRAVTCQLHGAHLHAPARVCVGGFDGTMLSLTDGCAACGRPPGMSNDGGSDLHCWPLVLDYSPGLLRTSRGGWTANDVAFRDFAQQTRAIYRRSVGAIAQMQTTNDDDGDNNADELR